jgi:Co/Zn/Cd efflux system component
MSALFGDWHQRRHRVSFYAEGALFCTIAPDAAVSGGVVKSALVIMTTGWSWVDPLAVCSPPPDRQILTRT